MTRRTILAGNWKMHKTVEESAALAASIAAALKDKPSNNSSAAHEVVVCPTYLALDRVIAELKGTSVLVGAQDMHWESQGAFTGKISGDMLRALGVTYVILGHSEQRAYFHETDETVNKKALKALAEGLKPILCVGETLEEREGGVTEKVVETQLRGAYAGISAQDALNTVVAYEPVWAIGTGRTATSQQAQEVHKFIRGLLTSFYDSETAEAVRIQYGGSMKAENAAELLAQPDVDGGLIGGAALKADTFLGIITAS
ncbi:MAG: Triose-phosphate isomerase [Fibrobacteria bacterium]|jgi:triosephosphate isomerase|nr:Triose-phosphate isomerase [Fibrobacteria bacterium]